jgi:hypothetical protein
MAAVQQNDTIVRVLDESIGVVEKDLGYQPQRA